MSLVSLDSTLIGLANIYHKYLVVAHLKKEKQEKDNFKKSFSPLPPFHLQVYKYRNVCVYIYVLAVLVTAPGDLLLETEQHKLKGFVRFLENSAAYSQIQKPWSTEITNSCGGWHCPLR